MAYPVRGREIRSAATADLISLPRENGKLP